MFEPGVTVKKQPYYGMCLCCGRARMEGVMSLGDF